MAMQDYAKSGDSVAVSLSTKVLGSYPLYRLHSRVADAQLMRFCPLHAVVMGTGLIQVRPVQINGRVAGNTCSLITSVLQIG